MRREDHLGVCHMKKVRGWSPRSAGQFDGLSAKTDVLRGFHAASFCRRNHLRGKSSKIGSEYSENLLASTDREN